MRKSILKMEQKMEKKERIFGKFFLQKYNSINYLFIERLVKQLQNKAFGHTKFFFERCRSNFDI